MKSQSHGITRREFLKGTGVVGMATAMGAGGLLTACGQPTGGGGAEGPVDLVHFIWVGSGQGIVPREVKREYERDHPEVSIELMEGSNAETYPKMVAQKEVDPNDPLVNFGFFNIWATTSGVVDDMWVSLDPEKIPNLNDIPEQYIRPNNKGVAWGMGAIGLVYNNELVDEPPESWMDIFDERFKGRVLIYDYRLSYNGFHAIADMHGGDVEKAWELYSQAAADGQWHSLNSGTQIYKDTLESGEALIAPYFIGHTMHWDKVSYVVPKEGMIAFPLLFQIVNGSSERQIDVASEIINTYISPETLSRYCNLTGNIPTNPFAKLDKDLAIEPAFQPDAVESAIQLDWDYIAEHDAEWRERWDREVKARM
jgi:putative spermidine/putrescine transport system substrate-binding protein